MSKSSTSFTSTTITSASSGPPAWLFTNNVTPSPSTTQLAVTVTSDTMAKTDKTLSKPVKAASSALAKSGAPLTPAPSNKSAKSIKSSPSTQKLPPQLVDLVESFLCEQGFDRAHREFKKQRTTEGLQSSSSPVKVGDKENLSLLDVFQSWRSTASKGSSDSSSSESSGESDSDDDSDSDSSSDSDSEESVNGDVSMVDAPAVEASSSESSSSDSSSDSDSDSDDGKPIKSKRPSTEVVPAAKKSLKRKAESDSESSSSDSDSDSDDGGNRQSKKLKTQKLKTQGAAVKKVESSSESSSDADSSDDATDSDSGSDSDSDSSDSSDSEAENEEKLKTAAKVPLPDSDSSSSESDSESEEEKPKKKTTVVKTLDAAESDSSVTLAKASPEFAPLPPDPTTLKANNRGKNGAQLKTQNQPFSRISKDVVVDPRLASNAYVSHGYGEQAHRDLIVTKGKGFTKEKNKKKRGSYKGGPLDVHTSRSFKFDD